MKIFPILTPNDLKTRTYFVSDRLLYIIIARALRNVIRSAGNH